MAPHTRFPTVPCTCTGKKTDLAVALAKSGRFPVKTVAATLQVARSNIIERRDGSRPQRGPQSRAGDLDLIADIRHLVDQRPTYGYRRIAALLKRERRSAGREPVNAKRIFRLMKKHGLLLQPYTGRRRAREHDGKIITIRSNIRWCADALEFIPQSRARRATAWQRPSSKRSNAITFG